MANRNAFRDARVMLLECQSHLAHRPNKKDIPKLVSKIVKAAGLKGESSERYFRLLATCALLKREPMYNNFKRKKRR